MRDLSGRFEHRLFLSATPHNGHSNSFSTLLELLDPYRFTRGVKVRGKKVLEDVMVRRLKEDIRSVQGGFPRRVVQRVVIDGLPEDAPELALSRLLDEYRNLREARFAAATTRTQAAAGLLVVGLQQRLLSSIEAFARSLKVHRATVERQWKKGQAATAAREANTLAELFTSSPDSDDERGAWSAGELEADEAAQIDGGRVTLPSVPIVRGYSLYDQGLQHHDLGGTVCRGLSSGRRASAMLIVCWRVRCPPSCLGVSG